MVYLFPAPAGNLAVTAAPDSAAPEVIKSETKPSRTSTVELVLAEVVAPIRITPSQGTKSAANKYKRFERTQKSNSQVYYTKQQVRSSEASIKAKLQRINKHLIRSFPIVLFIILGFVVGGLALLFHLGQTTDSQGPPIHFLLLYPLIPLAIIWALMLVWLGAIFLAPVLGLSLLLTWVLLLLSAVLITFLILKLVDALYHPIDRLLQRGKRKKQIERIEREGMPE